MPPGGGRDKIGIRTTKVCVVRIKPRVGDIQKERRLWLAGTVLMAIVPAQFAAASILHPVPIDPALAESIGSAVLTPPAWLTQLVGPIDHALRTSGPSVLPALVVLVLLLRMWIRYGRTLFKPVPLRGR